MPRLASPLSLGVGTVAAGAGAAALALGAGVGAVAVAGVGGAIAFGSSMIFQRTRSWNVFLSRTRIDYKREVGDPATNSAVGAVVQWIARNFPVPVGIRPEGSESDEDRVTPGMTGPGAMLRLLEKPNGIFGGRLQWMATITDFCCRGNAYWIKQRNGSGRVIAYWWIPERYLEPRWPDNDPSVFIGWYEYRVDGVLYAIDPNDVVHFRYGIDPHNTRKGLSPLGATLREIFTDDEAANFTASLLRNLGIPGVTISPTNTVTQRLTKFDPDVIKASFMEKFGGDKRGEPFVSELPMEVKVLGFNPEQMQLREIRRIPEERISANLGVPASVANLGAGLDQNAFTSYDTAAVVAYTQGVIPIQELIAADLEVQALKDFVNIETSTLDVFFDYAKAAAMQGAIADKWKRHESAATKGLIMRSDFKRGVGMRPKPGDDVYIMPNNYLVGSGGPSAPGPRPAIAPPPQRGELNAGARVAGLLDAGLLAGVEAAEVRCAGEFRGEVCGKLFAELASPPYRFSCDRCGTVTEAVVELEVSAA